MAPEKAPDLLHLRRKNPDAQCAVSTGHIHRADCCVVVYCTLAGCTVGPNYKRPAAPVPAQWQVAEPFREATPKDAIPKTSWWTVFHDDELNTLENELLAANQTLKVAIAHYDQARASAAVQNATLFPSVGVGATADGSVIPAHVPRAPTFLSQARSRKTVIPFPSASVMKWILFGKRRRTIEAAQASFQASAADLESVRLVLTAELAADYFTLRQIDTQLASIREPSIRCKKGWTW